MFRRFKLSVWTAAAVGLLLGSSAAARDADFGQQWVRNHPFTIMGSSSGPFFNLDQYHGAGLNVVLSQAWLPVARTAAREGAPWHVNVTHRPTDFYDCDYSYLPGGSGIYVWDEMGDTADMAAAAAAVQHFRNTYPDKLIYVNAARSGAFPNADFTYDSYLDAVVHQVQSDVLMFDMYPLRSSGATFADEWFTSLMSVRNKGLANNRPYWGYLQSFRDPGLRTPSESDTRYNGFTLLTAGFTGLAYYTYDRYWEGTADAGQFFDTGGNPTAFYGHAAVANQEYANLGQSLRHLTSTGVRFVPGRHMQLGGAIVDNTPPSSVANWSAGAGADPHIQSVAVNTALPGHLGLGKDGLIGFFTDDDNQRYFMLTNLYHGGDLSAAAAALSFNITFDNSVNSIWRLNRQTGLAQEIALANHALNWTLPGGTGDLFKYDNGNFAGLFDSPPPPNVPQSNFIVNGSWEGGCATPSPWTQTYNVFIGPATILADSRALDGGHVLGGSFPVAQGGVGEIQYEDQSMNLQYAPDTVYTFTAHAFTDDPSLVGFLQLIIGSSEHGNWRVTNEANQSITFNAGDGTLLAPDGVTKWNQLTATVDTSLHPELVGRWIAPAFGARNAYVDLLSFTATSTTLPGDFDGDGDVDGADFVVWQTNFPTQSGATLATGDADGDGDVDGADFVVWQTNFPTTPGAGATAVPEPKSWMLIVTSTTAAYGFVCRRKCNSKSIDCGQLVTRVSQ